MSDRDFAWIDFRPEIGCTKCVSASLLLVFVLSAKCLFVQYFSCSLLPVSRNERGTQYSFYVSCS